MYASDLDADGLEKAPVTELEKSAKGHLSSYSSVSSGDKLSYSARSRDMRAI